ncbi:MAG: zinc-dependent peptidase [Nitrosospira sp.]|nr:zinc-dependent peptidase [Nitrosospira sp.]MDN5882061.1 zinc-dependent peptidase [Nitrosospira sp.]MDN5936147.1 zinc-dependent peptidase [Nitrosospira sp.]
MSWNFKTWYRHRILENESIPDDLWRETVARLRFLRGLSRVELKRLRECATLFLHAKQINGAHGLIITGEMHVMIAVQACVLILNLDLDYYDGWVEIIVYPGEFIRDYEYADEDGVVHRGREPLSGESWLGGPVILSWEDAAVAEAETKPDAGYNVVIHEFAHKLDMLNGDANGFPPLHADMSQQAWSETFSKAYADFCLNVDADEPTVIDPYAAESPAEFFAVMSEAFFETPLVVKLHFSAVYEQLALFYRQEPAQRWIQS